MQDADEGTSFENVQTASVKRSLAQDSNNDKLHQSALMEMIGHLSKENKEPYLKHSQPLQKYIDTKDEFDFKHNNYTTTENVDKTPNENVRQLQRELNESGYTDKFGQPLKEDGIYAGKTAYADDRRRVDNPSREQAVNTDNTAKNDNTKLFSKEDLTFEEQIKIGQYVYGDSYNPYIHALNITDDGMVATYPITVNASGPMGPVYEYVDDILNKVNNSFKKAVLLNNSEGASTLGHNAVMLINKDNEGLVFSFYPTNSNFTKSILTTAEVRFGVLSSKEVNDLLNEKTKNEFKLIASDNSVVEETYDRAICYDLTTTGYNMYNAAVALYDCPSYYSLAIRHCDDIAVELLRTGGINPFQFIWPNATYDISKILNDILN